MIEEILKKIKKNETLVLLPKSSEDYYKSFNYMFENVVIVPELFEENRVIGINDLINEKAIKNLILVDYADVYRFIIPYLSSNISIKWIMTYPLASLTNGAIMNVLRNMLEFYDRDLVNRIGLFDNSLYLSLKKAGYPVFHLLPDFNYIQKEIPNSNDLSIISFDYNPNHGYYNMLSALKLIQYDKVKLNFTMQATKNFVNDFNIKYEEISDLDLLSKNNALNMYVNFTNSEICKILESMDYGIPCLLGNTDLFDNFKYLKKMLVLNSDDDVDEIALKIKNILSNRQEIINEYVKFRKWYIQCSSDLVKKFLD